VLPLALSNVALPPQATKTPPLPVYVYNYSANQNFGVNSLSGASFDAPYAFDGSATTLDALHVRYDQNLPVKTFWSFEHHSVFGDTGYAVFSVNPASQPDKQWNLLGYDQAGARSAFTLNAQLFTVQSGLATPSSSSGFADAQFTHALAQSSLRLDLTQSYDTLIAAGQPDHPFVAGLQWTGYDQPLFKSGFTYRIQSGLANVHDAFGIAGTPLADVLPAQAMTSITTSGRMVFHMVGDTGGIKSHFPEQNVARAMEIDFQAGDIAARPSFFYHLGDVVYYFGEATYYYD